MIYSKYDGYEEWYDYDEFGKLIRYRNSNGITKWYNTLGKCIRIEDNYTFKQNKIIYAYTDPSNTVGENGYIYILNFSKYDYILVTE